MTSEELPQEGRRRETKRLQSYGIKTVNDETSRTVLAADKDRGVLEGSTRRGLLKWDVVVNQKR